MRAGRWLTRHPPLLPALLVCFLAGLGAAFVGQALRLPAPPPVAAPPAGPAAVASPAKATAPPAAPRSEAKPAPAVAPQVSPPEPPLEPPPQSAADFRPPTRGRVTSSFGWRRDPVFGDFRFHPGLDLVGQPGEALTAAFGGKVTAVRRVDSDYGREPAGWEITVRHPGEWSTRYRFGGKPLVAEGGAVRRGEPLATLDQAARIHFGLYRGDVAETPPGPVRPGE